MGTPWCQLPAAYGKGNLVYRRWAAWCDRGVWSRLMASLQTDLDLSAGLRDSTVVRAHVSAAGAPKTRGRMKHISTLAGSGYTQSAQNLPQYDLDLAEVLPRHGLKRKCLDCLII